MQPFPGTDGNEIGSGPPIIPMLMAGGWNAVFVLIFFCHTFLGANSRNESDKFLSDVFTNLSSDEWQRQMDLDDFRKLGGYFIGNQLFMI